MNSSCSWNGGGAKGTRVDDEFMVADSARGNGP